MTLKYQLNFKLRPYGKKSACQIQMHVTYEGRRQVFSTGSHVDNREAWDEENQLVRSGYKGKNGETAQKINASLRKYKDEMDRVFMYFEVNELTPMEREVAEKFAEQMGKKAPKPRAEKPKEIDFYDVFQRFTQECGERNAWTKATHEKMDALKNDLLAFNKNLSFERLTDAMLTRFVAFLRDEKQLRTPRHAKGEREDYDKDDLVGLKNTTIEKKLGYLKWFLNWATENGYNTNRQYKTFRPTLKKTQKKVIFLTREELERVKNLELAGPNRYLEPLRDVFIFCCFSGLRHSDVANLRRRDVKEDHIEVTTVKTADSISIELNKVTRDILKKYASAKMDSDYALPVLTNQAMNRNLKELCKLAGIDEEIRVTTYKGNERIDEIHPKWELVGTHTGRRTFIVNALSLGVPPNVVMKWTGHSDYNAMKPYIDIVDSIKAEAMKKLDTLL